MRLMREQAEDSLLDAITRAQGERTGRHAIWSGAFVAQRPRRDGRQWSIWSAERLGEDRRGERRREKGRRRAGRQGEDE
eukprot:2133855-Pleurochrysis_carterae.AAC.1